MYEVGNNKTNVSTYLNRRQYEKIKDESEKTGISISSLLKILINDYIKKEEL